MRVAKLRLPSGKTGVGVVQDDSILPIAFNDQYRSLFEIFEATDPRATFEMLLDGSAEKIAFADAQVLAPIDAQEIWAAGVTYKRSKTARMEESEKSADCYDLVYQSDRPELFFKANARRCVGPGQELRIRSDSKWNVPEPELALVLNSRLALIGFTIGNDMSSRDIEGENPLYLPQAKVYNQCCSLGPCVTLVGGMPSAEKVGIKIRIARQGNMVFEGETNAAQMARPLSNLIEYLGRDNSFPEGVILLTGTGVVPDNDFTLAAGDEIAITIDAIGTLTNTVVQG